MAMPYWLPGNRLREKLEAAIMVFVVGPLAQINVVHGIVDAINLLFVLIFQIFSPPLLEVLPSPVVQMLVFPTNCDPSFMFVY